MDNRIVAETEDVPYSVSSPGAPKNENKLDVDQPNKSILIQLVKQIELDIETQKSFDSVNLPQNATMEQKIAVFDEIAIHKGLAMHLDNYKTMLQNKIKELR